MIDKYRLQAKKVFTTEDLEFAKAVYCLKMICVVKVGHG